MGWFRNRGKRAGEPARREPALSRFPGRDAANRKELPPSPDPEPGRKRRRGKLGVRAIYLLIALLLWGSVAAAGLGAYAFLSLPQGSVFAIPDREPGMMVLASDGQVLAERGAFFGDQARIAELPDYLPKAVIAIEDRRFYQHFGIDLVGLARATYENWRAGQVVQGGSTITQQLAKNLFLEPDKTMKRKFQEAVLALWLERKFSKDEILQLYLNRVYFGGSTHGIEKAAQHYYAKSAKDLTLAEAAILAATLKAPTRYNPIAHPELAQERARLVLQNMQQEGFISEEEIRFAVERPAEAKPIDYIPATQYIVDWVASQVPELVGELKDNIVVETTIERKIQNLAEQVIRVQLAKEGPKVNVSQAAMVVMSPHGAVLAMVGGKSYIKSQFNRAVNAKRQPGSSFKPFVYLTAIEQGFGPDSMVVDQPVKFGEWAPENYDGKYRGAMPLRAALARSINSVAAQLVMETGPQNVVDIARRMGIQSEIQPVPSVALGTSEVSLLELTAAYAPFANGGYAIAPHAVKRITTRDGKVLYQRQHSDSGAVMTPEEVGTMNEMLRGVIAEGTGRGAAIAGLDVAGKTGTTQSYRDAWFMGFSAHYVTGVWVGNDDFTPTKKVTGGSFPATIWREVMTPIHKGVQRAALPGVAPEPGYGSETGIAGVFRDWFGQDPDAPRTEGGGGWFGWNWGGGRREPPPGEWGTRLDPPPGWTPGGGRSSEAWRERRRVREDHLDQSRR